VICAATLLAALMFSLVNADGVGGKNRAANRLYNQGEYGEALKLYDDALQLDPSDGKLKMNRGSALYRLGEFEEAERSYLDALSSQMDKRTRADAHYNLGNVQFRQGEQHEIAGDAASARGKYSQAMENYINTLKLRPNDKDAKWNLQLAHQKVDMLEGQEDRQRDQDGGDEQQDGDDGGDGQDKDDNQNQDNNQGGDDQNQDDQRRQQDQNQDQAERDMKREEAERLIQQYADDADTLNRPPRRKGKIRQPERDW
jgi:tetratricopeptide (TPR) repeat protein